MKINLETIKKVQIDLNEQVADLNFIYNKWTGLIQFAICIDCGRIELYPTKIDNVEVVLKTDEERFFNYNFSLVKFNRKNNNSAELYRVGDIVFTHFLLDTFDKSVTIEYRID